MHPDFPTQTMSTRIMQLKNQNCAICDRWSLNMFGNLRRNTEYNSTQANIVILQNQHGNRGGLMWSAKNCTDKELSCSSQLCTEDLLNTLQYHSPYWTHLTTAWHPFPHSTESLQRAKSQNFVHIIKPRYKEFGTLPVKFSQIWMVLNLFLCFTPLQLV